MKKGDRFLCIKDYVYDTFEYIFTEGQIYVCEEPNTLPNDWNKENYPIWQNTKEFNVDSLGRKFPAIDYWPQYFRQLHEEEDE